MPAKGSKKPDRGLASSVYWTKEEYELLQFAGEMAGVARNSIVRIAVRRLLGLPRISSSRVEALIDELAGRDERQPRGVMSQASPAAEKRLSAATRSD